MSDLENQKAKGPPPITAEEFDRRAEAGEDLDEYFDWENAVTVAPGEMSPGQIASIVAMFNGLPQAQQLLLMQTMLDSFAGLKTSLNISIPFPLLWQMTREATSRHLSLEAFVQSLLAQHFGQQEITR